MRKYYPSIYPYTQKKSRQNTEKKIRNIKFHKIYAQSPDIYYKTLFTKFINNLELYYAHGQEDNIFKMLILH